MLYRTWHRPNAQPPCYEVYALGQGVPVLMGSVPVHSVPKGIGDHHRYAVQVVTHVQNVTEVQKCDDGNGWVYEVATPQRRYR